VVFGLQWLRKAVLHTTGHQGLHDENAIFQREMAAAVVIALAGFAVKAPLARVP
jgi:uncharacterized membrane protein